MDPTLGETLSESTAAIQKALTLQKEEYSKIFEAGLPISQSLGPLTEALEKMRPSWGDVLSQYNQLGEAFRTAFQQMALEKKLDVSETKEKNEGKSS